VLNLKNFIFKIFTPRPRPKKERRDRFLIVSTTGLGDTLWATPAIRALRQKHPSAYIAVLTSPLGAEVLKNNPHITETFIVRSPALWSLLALYRSLKKREIDTVLLFHASQRPVFPFCAWLRPSAMAGTKGQNKGLDFLLTEALEAKPIHEIVRRLEIVGLPDADRSMELFIQDAPPALSLEGPIIGLHPGAKDKFKQWPPSHFIQIGRRLQARYGASIVVTGSGAEKELVEAIAGQIPGAAAVTEGLSVHSLGALIKKMKLLISNDTGPMHIACAVGTPVVAPFAPTDARLCGPLASWGKAIQKPKTCTPCLRKKCRDPFCMRQISVNEVFEEAVKLCR